MLTDEEKIKIQAYICDPDNKIHPDTFLSPDKKEEGFNYAKFITDREKLKMLSKIGKTNRKHLNLNEIEDLKDACKTEDDRALVRDLTDTGLRLKDVLRKRANGEVLR